MFPTDPNELVKLARIHCQLPPDNAVERKVAQTLQTFQDLFPDKTFVAPEVVYDLKGQTAAYALSYKNGTCKIRVNVELLYGKHKDEMINQTIPHEVCHIVATQLHGRNCGHGFEWKILMHKLGLPPRRCHNYEVTKAPYVYKCNCREYRLTQIRHRRIRNGVEYVCRYCNKELIYVRTDA